MELKLKKKEKSPLCNAVQKLELLRWVILFLSTLTQGMDGGFLDEAQLEMDFCKEFLSEQSPPATIIGGSLGTGKSLTFFTWAWIQSCAFKKSFVFISFLGSAKSFPLEF